jgi:hypothetical protein
MRAIVTVAAFTFAALSASALVASDLAAQGANPRRSQRQEIVQMVGATRIEAMYVRPVARGREIWGALVPYGKLWTPSADSAMRLTFSTDVQIAGQTLKAGSYSVWATPDTAQWAIVFNSVQSAFHLRHTDTADVLKLTAKVDSLPHVETLTLGFPVVDGKKAVMQIQWGTRAVSLDIEVP